MAPETPLRLSANTSMHRPALPPVMPVVRQAGTTMAAMDATGYIRDWLLCGPFPGRELTPEERRPIDSSGYSQAPFLRGGHLTDCLTSAGGEPKPATAGASF